MRLSAVCSGIVIAVITGGCGESNTKGHGAAATPITKPVASFYAHRGDIVGLAFTPDGQNIISASSDGTIGKWDPKTGEPKLKIVQRESRYYGRFAIAKEGDRFLTAVDIPDDTPPLQQWQLTDGKELRELVSHRFYETAGDYVGISDIAISDRGTRVVSIDNRGDVIAWDSDRGDILLSLRAMNDFEEGWSNAAAISRDGKFGASSEVDKIRIFDLDTKTVMREFATDHLIRGSLAFSPDGNMLAAVRSGHVRLYDTITGQVIKKLMGDDTNSTNNCRLQENVAFSSSGQSIAAGCGNRILVWDIASGVEIHRIVADEKWEFHAVEFSPDGKLIATGDNRRINVWAIESGNDLQLSLTNFVDDADPQVPVLIESTSLSNSSTVSSFQISEDGKKLVAANYDNNILFIDLATQAITESFKGVPNEEIDSLYIFRDKSKVLSVSRDRTIRLRSSASGSVLKTFSSVSQNAGFAVSYDEKRLISHDLHQIFVWDIESGDLVKTTKIDESVTCINSCINSIAISPTDSNFVAIAVGLNEVQLWNIATSSIVKKFQTKPSKPGYLVLSPSLQFSRGGKRLLVANFDGLNLWDIERTKQILHIEMPYYEQRNWKILRSPVLSADGNYIGFAVQDHGVVWDVAANKEVLKCAIYDRINIFKNISGSSIAISPDNRYFIMNDVSNLLMWDVSQFLK